MPMPRKALPELGAGDPTNVSTANVVTNVATG